MPVEIRELVIRASIPEQKEGSSLATGTVAQRASAEAPKNPRRPQMTPESTEKIIELCVARVMELLNQNSYR